MSDALGGAREGVLREIRLERGAQCLAHAGAPTTSANSDSGSLRQASISSPAASNSCATLSRSCLQLISVRSDSPAANGIAPDAGNRHQLRPARHEMHLDPVRHRLVERPVLERATDRSPTPSSWLSTSSMFRLNAAVTPWASL